MQQINADIDYLKQTMGTQVAACETLWEVFAKLDSSLTAVEAHAGPDATSPVTCLSAVEIQPGPALRATGLSSIVMEKSLGPEPALPLELMDGLQ